MGGFKTFAIGDVLTASDVNGFLMSQVIIQCTSGSRPSSPVDGMTIYETDTDRMLTWKNSAWVDTASLGAVSTTTGLANATGFTTVSFLGKKTAAGVCSVWVVMACTSTITSSSGNLVGDPQLCALPVGYRPPENTTAVFGNGVVDGEAVIGTDGNVVLRTASGDIGSGTNVRLHSTFLL